MKGRPRYAYSGEVAIAYVVLSESGPDTVFIPGFASNVAEWHRHPAAANWAVVRDATRLITFDKRGTGLSDRTVEIADLETRMDDVRAVMDAAGSERAHLIGLSEGGPLATLFAATHPDRVASLTLMSSFARYTRSPSHPWLPSRDEALATRDLAVEFWGTGHVIESMIPETDRSPELLPLLGDLEMTAASPGALHRLFDVIIDIDVCDVLPTVRVPTLVLHHEGDQSVPVESGRYLAEHIPGARFVLDDLQGHMSVGDTRFFDEVVEFITGSRPTVPDERVLATVLFTDIVGSTERAAAEGDAAWRALLDRHDEISRAAVTEHRGVAVKSTGDGFLARFDGPGRAVACARAIGQRLATVGLEVRAGLHAGEIELRGDDIGGLAVHVAARVAGLADAAEVLATRTVKDLTVGSGLEFDDRGEQDLKGVPDRWTVYALR